MTSPSQSSNLEELFSKDPLTLSDHDIDSIVNELRARRVLWASQEKEKADKPKRAPKSKTPVNPAAIADLLGEIEI